MRFKLSSQSLGQHQRSVVFYGVPPKIQPDDDLVVLVQIKEPRNCLIMRDPSVQKLLQKAGMEVDNQGRLPITPPLFERLWALVESQRLRQSETREVGDAKGLSCPLTFTCNNASTITIGDSSDSKGDSDEDGNKELLILFPEIQGYASGGGAKDHHLCLGD